MSLSITVGNSLSPRRTGCVRGDVQFLSKGLNSVRAQHLLDLCGCGGLVFAVPMQEFTTAPSPLDWKPCTMAVQAAG